MMAFDWLHIVGPLAVWLLGALANRAGIRLDGGAIPSAQPSAKPAVASGHPFLDRLFPDLLPLVGRANAGALLSAVEQQLLDFGAPLLRRWLDSVSPPPAPAAPAKAGPGA